MPKTMDFYLPKSMENSLPLTSRYFTYKTFGGGSITDGKKGCKNGTWKY